MVPVRLGEHPEQSKWFAFSYCKRFSLRVAYGNYILRYHFQRRETICQQCHNRFYPQC